MARFQKIRELLRKLLHMPTVNIEVQHDNSQIIVERDGLRLPLESYGTGVHELIILAIAVYSQDNVLFCIEEPEIHLHPRLQKEFLSFLIESTSNKYVLTTHSNAFLIPSKEVQVSHLWLQDEATRSRTIETPEHALSVLSDLGIKASDILQANSVIWVEGPSDRIYINHWLGLLEPDLREGIDYSIMFYGGSLLSHLSMGRTAAETADELIELLRINQNSMVVIDSDNKNEKSNINTTKQRVRRECRQNGLAYWITWGREIENYISAKCIATAYGEITGTTPDGLSFGKFDKLEKCLTAAYGKKWKPSWSYNDAKPARARELVKCITKEDLDKPLLKNIKPLIDAIILATRDPESSG